MPETRTAKAENDDFIIDQLKAKTVHVDTSLQIEQQKIHAQSGPVKRALAQYGFRSTSTYAKKEFKRAWLQDLNLIYKVSKDCAGIEDVYYEINKKLWRPEAKRRLSRCVDAIRAFLKGLPGETRTSVLVVRLRSHICEAILTGYLAWERSVTHEHDGTGCVRAKERPFRAANGTIDVTVRDCRTSKIQCTVHKFFSEQRGHFDKIQLAILGEAEPSRELQRTGSTIEAASHDPVILCDNSNCSAMSDALIAVDGINMDHFAANNPREWEMIAKALEKPLINPVGRADV